MAPRTRDGMTPVAVAEKFGDVPPNVWKHCVALYFVLMRVLAD